MEKLDLQKFRELKQEIVDKLREAEERGEELSDREREQFLTRYKEIIEILSEHDLSDIDFEEWRGMFLYADEERPLDFSKTRANIDFSIIEYETSKVIPNFKSCQIKNFDFERNIYSPEMFDEEYRKENAEHFLSDRIKEDVANRFYNGELTLTDIQNNPELANKIEEKNLAYGLREIYRIIGREEFCKLDAQFIDETREAWVDVLTANSNLRTAEEIMPVLYQSARERILGYSNDFYLLSRFDHRQDRLGERFREQNPDLFLGEEVPENVRDDYYNHSLSILKFSRNLQYFKGKKVAQSFKPTSLIEKKIVSLYGDNVYQLFEKYKPLMDKLLTDDAAVRSIEVPNGPITDEQRKEIMEYAFIIYLNRNGFEEIKNFDELKMLMDFVSIDDFPISPVAANLIDKYGIDKIIESGIDFYYLFQGGALTNIEKISSIRGIEFEDIKTLINLVNDEVINDILDRYDIKQLLEFGVKDLSELIQINNNLYEIRELLEKRPIDLIYMGDYGKDKKRFIERYGIDNIIALDEETGGMFSHQMWQQDIYLTLLACAEKNAPKLDEDKILTYEDFKNRMYEILLHARDDDGLLLTRDYPGYDFIHGKFREEHPDIFLDGDLPGEVKEKFYTRSMTAETIRQNPELIQLLQGKDLSRVFLRKMTMTAGLGLIMMGKDGRPAGGIPNIVNMPKYLSGKLGQEEFLKICADYGECLDHIKIVTENETTVESIKEIIDQALYKQIKEYGMEYFEELPLSFHEKHPELFLPKEIDEDIRRRFYKGSLIYSDIRKNPQIKELLLTKDLSVGFGKLKFHESFLFITDSHRENAAPIWEKLSEREIMDLAERYGDYLRGVNDDVFIEGQTEQDRISAIQAEIEYNILNRYIIERQQFGTPRKRVRKYSSFNEDVPEFFKDKHPEMFLDTNAPKELKDAFYDSGKISFKLIKEHPEWREFLQGKDLRRAFPEEYSELFRIFDSATLLKLGTRNPETIEKMVSSHKEDILLYWYKSTGGKFIPHHVVMLNFPLEEIDNFLSNGKKWSQLMRIGNYNLNDDGKAAILKISYAMGVFHGNDDGFNRVMKLFTDVPQELTQEEYEMAIEFSNGELEQAYTLNNDGKYVFNMDKQKNKDSVKTVREILEKAQLPKILTIGKAHQMFDSFIMEYNPDFVRFFNENIEEILSNSEYTKNIATMQRQFKDIVRTNAGRRLTLDVALDYIMSIAYTGIDVGNERVAEQAKIAGYSQKDFEAIQSLFNEGETRDFSSIPRIQGKINGYTYEMLRCDDPLALTIGTLTDCCQEIHGFGQTSMEHSMVSPDGRVFCVRDSEGRLVAQSWFWRNQYTGCFDNIEIPDRIFELYEKEHPGFKKKGLTDDVLEVYKKAAQDLMQEDARVYQELLENGTITQEQYDALLLGRVTIGAGFNDIKYALRERHRNGEFKLDASNEVLPKKSSRFPYIYDDSHYEPDHEHDGQYIIAERDGIVKSEHENLYVHQDDIPEYDGSNMTATVLLTIKRMEQETDRDNLEYLSGTKDEESLPKSQRIINSIAREYGLNPDTTKIMATARIALIYSKDKDNKIKIGDLLSSPIKSTLTEEQRKKAEAHIMYQIQKALKQIGIQDSEVDLSSLSEEQKQMIQSAIQEIEKENDERGE